MAKRLTPKQEAFCREYVRNGGNATQAVLEAYDFDSYDAARTQASDNLALGHIQARISKLAKVDALSPEMIVALHARLATSNIEDFLNERGSFDLAQAIRGNKMGAVRRIVTEQKQYGEKVSLEMYDKQRSLDSLARFLGMDKGRLELEAGDKLGDLLDAAMPWSPVQDAQDAGDSDAEAGETEEDDAD